MPVLETWIRAGLEITGHFEDSEDPFGGVTGDFDGMGISLGVLQWNIGSGSLQPMVTAVGRAEVVGLMPVFGGELWSACTANIAQGLAVVRGWQNGQQLRPPIRAELKAFAHSSAFVAEQLQAANELAENAAAAARRWNADAGQPEPTLQEFCWFFDLLTQNGGLKGVSPATVRSFLAKAGPEQADDVICDWLQERTSADAGFKDAHKNAALWRSAVPSGQLSLFVASYLRSQKARQAWRADVLNRKGTIALGTGWVHGEKHDFRKQFRETPDFELAEDDFLDACCDYCGSSEHPKEQCPWGGRE